MIKPGIINELKQRVYDFVQEWFEVHVPKIESSPWVDPRAKAVHYLNNFNLNKSSDAHLWIKGFCTVSSTDVKLRKFRWYFQNRLRKFKQYKLFSHKGDLISESVKQDFSKIDLRAYLKSSESSDPWRTKLPIATSSVCKVVGVYRGPYRKLNDKKEYGMNRVAFNTIRENDSNYQFDDAIVVSGSWENNSMNVRVMAQPKKAEFSVKQLIDGYFSRVGVDFVLPKLRYYNADTINGIGVKKTAYPGLMTSIMFGSNRGETTKYTKPIAIEYINKVINKVHNFYDMSLSAIGGREKRVSLNPNNFMKEIRSRVVIMGEDLPMLIGLSVASPITKAFQRLNDGFCFIGRSMEQLNYLDIIKKVKGDNVKTISCNSDFSNHDAHVGHTQLIVAFGILRLIFPKNWRFMDKLFYYCASGVIYKFIVLPESKLIYRVSKGIATGHAFTSLINTMCAYGTFATAINENCTEDEISDSYIIVGGDDVICKLPIDKVKDINDSLQISSGMVIDNLDEHVGMILSSDYNLQNTFFKRKFALDGVSWNNPEVYESLIFSPSGLKNYIGEARRLIEMIMQGPNDQLVNTIFLEFLVKMISCNYRANDSPVLDFLKHGLNMSSHEIVDFITGSEKDIFKKSNEQSSLSNSKLVDRYSRMLKARVRLANTWFITSQLFPLYGKKDDNYWIAASKLITKPHVIQDRHEFWIIVDQYSSLNYVFNQRI